MGSEVKLTGRYSLLYWKSRFKTQNLLQRKYKDTYDHMYWEYRETDRIYVFLYNMRPTILYCRKTNSTGELRSSIYEMYGLSSKIRLFCETKELLDDDEMHYCYKQISVVYGDEIAVHVKNEKGRYITFGIHGLDKVQTLKDKLPGVFYQTDSLLRNGEELDSNDYISSYNIRNGNVLESGYEHSRVKIRKMSQSEYREESPNVTSRKTGQDDSSVVMDTDELKETVQRFELICESLQSVTGLQPTFDINITTVLKECFNAFGRICGSMERALPTEQLKSLAKRVGKPALEMMASSIIGLLKEGGIGLPDILQRASDKILSDQDLVGIADATGGNWQLLGYALGLKQSRIDQIVLDNHSTAMRVFSMLKRWATENIGGPKAGTLLRAMWDCRSLTVTWETIFQMFA